MPYKGYFEVIVYCFGAFFFVLAAIQLWACKSENRFAIFLVSSALSSLV